jgi:hypothetical protein
MLRTVFRVAWFAMLCLLASAASGQTSSATGGSEPCNKACQQQKLDTLFRAMDAAETSRRPKPSDSTECVTYDGRELPATLIDVCAKLKYVRALPVGTETRFACPSSTGQLVGLSPARIRSIWGEPDYESREKWGDQSSPVRQWTYFIGSPKPNTKGGGFPELSLHFNGTSKVESVTCTLSK